MIRKITLLPLTVLLFLWVAVKAQNVSINNTQAPPHPSAMLDVSSPAKGVLLPKVSLQALNMGNPINNPAKGLIVYNTNVNLPGGEGYYYNAGNGNNIVAWTKLGASGNTGGWQLTGNAGTNSAINFIGTTDDQNVVFKRGGVNALEIANGGVLIARGSDGFLPFAGNGPMFLWLAGKSAFRAGAVGNNEWDDVNVGQYSFAGGVNTKATGPVSTTFGGGTTASDAYTTAMGWATVASGAIATSMGSGTLASGSESTAMGKATKATNTEATSMGALSLASGRTSLATGWTTIASGDHTASFGENTQARGTNAASMGFGTIAKANYSLVIGHFNDSSDVPDINVPVATDRLFVVGNGTSTNRSNALTLLRNGNLTIAGMLTENSDIRLKKDIQPLENMLDKIQAIQPISYNFKPNTHHTTERQIGFSAQEIEKYFPELVSKDPKGYLSVNYSHMTAVLLQAIKEQQTQINQKDQTLYTLQNTVNNLQLEIAELKKIVNKLMPKPVDK